jgi:hypothetical protein
MSVASAPPWPGSRVLLGWWRELAARRPQQLWFGRLLIHRIEALVRVSRARSFDPWQRALLQLVRTRAPCETALEKSFGDLQIDRQVLSRFVGELSEAGLIQVNGTGAWRLTDAGQHVLQTGKLHIPSEVRQTFYFVDHAEARRPAQFLSLRSPRQTPADPATGAIESLFDVSHLQACIDQSPQWKIERHFPAEIEALLLPRAGDSDEANWRRVILDSLEQRTLAFARTAGSSGDPIELGFPVRTEGWVLEAEPALTLAKGGEDALPDLLEEPPPEAWRQAWQSWCQPRNLPPAEVDACRLERCDHRLLVRAPHRLIERLRAARSDAIKQESWLLAGSGRIRPAAQIELQLL